MFFLLSVCEDRVDTYKTIIKLLENTFDHLMDCSHLRIFETAKRKKKRSEDKSEELTWQ